MEGKTSAIATEEFVQEQITNATDGLALALGEISTALNALHEKVDYDAIYEAGEKAEYDRFWDSFQRNGTLRNYSFAFAGNGWHAQTFRPKYDLIVENAQYMFAHGSLSKVDLTTHLESLGVALDTSTCTSFNHFLQYASPSRIPTLDTRSADMLNSLSYYSTTVITFDKIILRDDGSQTLSSAFVGNDKLTDIAFEGVIGDNIDFSACPLSVESMKSVIMHLMNMSGYEWTATVKFSQACWDALEADSKSPNGTTWQEYVDSLGWLH